MTLGMLGLLIAVGVAVTIPFAGAYQAQKDISSFGEGGVSAILGNFTAALMFLSLVLAGLHFRRRPEVHKRLLLLATITVLWPAFLRFRHFFPSVPNPEIWFALVLTDSLIIVAWIWDRWANGRVHPVLLYVGGFIIFEQSFEAITYDTETWRTIAKQLYAFF